MTDKTAADTGAKPVGKKRVNTRAAKKGAKPTDAGTKPPAAAPSPALKDSVRLKLVPKRRTDKSTKTVLGQIKRGIKPPAASVPAATAADPLETATAKTQRFSLAGRKVRAKCVSVYDGDTAQFVFALAEDGSEAPGASNSSRRVTGGGSEPLSPLYRFTCRMAGYNSAEMKTKSADEAAAGIAARDALRGKILDRIVTLELGEFDKYGRVLVDVFAGPVFVNSAMIDEGHGKPYQGRGEKAW